MSSGRPTERIFNVGDRVVATRIGYYGHVVSVERNHPGSSVLVRVSFQGHIDGGTPLDHYYLGYFGEARQFPLYAKNELEHID